MSTIRYSSRRSSFQPIVGIVAGDQFSIPLKNAIPLVRVDFVSRESFSWCFVRRWIL